MADLQSLIAAGLSPQDAASLLADLQRYETSGAPNLGYGFAPQSTMRDGVEYQSQYGGMDIIPGMTSGIFANLGIENPQLPVYSLMEAQAQNNPNDARRMSFMPTPGSAYRLVDSGTGEVVMSATTPEEYAALAQRANELAASEGKRANFQIQRQDPQSIGGGWTQMYSDTPDVAFDTTAQLLAAGMLAMTGAGLLQPGGLGGVGAGATGAGAGIGTGTSLAGAGLSSLPANLAAIQAGANAALATSGLSGLGAVGGGIASGVAGAGIGGGLGAGAGTAGLGATGAGVGAGAAGAGVGAGAGGLGAGLGTTGAGIGAGAGAGLGTGASTAATSGGKGLLGSVLGKLGISDYITLGSLAASGVGSLLGGGGTSAQTPYVSPFGAVGGIGAGRDMRANPNIADYEQYGFGPEATFFKPEYNQLVSSTFQPTTQAYRPLING